MSRLEVPEAPSEANDNKLGNNEGSQHGFSASFVASALTFFITGTYTLVLSTESSGLLGQYKFQVIAAILLNAVYFYYWIAFAEMDTETQKRLKEMGHLEWILRVANQALLFSLWFMLDQGKWVAFGASLSLVYVLYIIWDWLILRKPGDGYIKLSGWKDHWLIITLDFVGLGISLFFLHALSKYMALTSTAGHQGKVAGPAHSQDLSNAANMLGIVCTAYLIMAVIGIRVGHAKYKFQPLGKDWRRYWGAEAIR